MGFCTATTQAQAAYAPMYRTNRAVRNRAKLALKCPGLPFS